MYTHGMHIGFFKLGSTMATIKKLLNNKPKYKPGEKLICLWVRIARKIKT